VFVVWWFVCVWGFCVWWFVCLVISVLCVGLVCLCGECVVSGVSR